MLSRLVNVCCSLSNTLFCPLVGTVVIAISPSSSSHFSWYSWWISVFPLNRHSPSCVFHIFDIDIKLCLCVWRSRFSCETGPSKRIVVVPFIIEDRLTNWWHAFGIVVWDYIPLPLGIIIIIDWESLCNLLEVTTRLQKKSESRWGETTRWVNKQSTLPSPSWRTTCLSLSNNSDKWSVVRRYASLDNLFFKENISYCVCFVIPLTNRRSTKTEEQRHSTQGRNIEKGQQSFPTL